MSLAPPGSTRLLGRSRRYTATNLSARLHRWHAPRANRWECLYVIEGMLVTEWLDAAQVSTRRMAAGERCWIPPGTRWRVAHMDDDTGFELEVHADETVAAAAPQAIRAALLRDAAVIRARDRADLAAGIAALAPADLRLLRADFDARADIDAAILQSGGTLSWHPLEAAGDRCIALLVMTAAPAGLAEYMGRDHAVIEGALAGALHGHAECTPWLHAILARHLAIEEGLLFPAYLEAGGNKGWVRGLLNEHVQLREYLPRLDDAAGRRRFLLLLDGHDEKEEQIVYPDIAAHVASRAVELAQSARGHGLVID